MSTTTTSTTTRRRKKTGEDVPAVGEVQANSLAEHPAAPAPDVAGTVAERDARIAAAVKPFIRAIGSAVKDVRDIAATVRTGNEALGFARVRLGSALLPVFLVLTDEEGSFKWKNSSALDYLLEHYLKDEQDERGKPYNTTTVNAWIVAAQGEALLPEDQRGLFGSDAHRTMARVLKNKGERSFRSFANERVKKGEVSVGKVRAAYDKKYPAPAKDEPDAAAVAATITADFAPAAGPARAMFKRNNLAPSVVYSALYLACAIGQKYPDADPEATSMAIRTLLKEKKTS